MRRGAARARLDPQEQGVDGQEAMGGEAKAGTGPPRLASSEMQAQPGVMKTLHPGWMPHTTDSLYKKGGKNHEKHTSSPPPEFFLIFILFPFFFFRIVE